MSGDNPKVGKPKADGLSRLADVIEGLAHGMGELLDAVRENRARITDLERRVEVLSPGTGREFPPPADPLIALAVITGPNGVLIGRRSDGWPPWAFPGGKVEPGETPAQAIVREAAEETGLTVTAGHEIGRREHYLTRRTIVYIAATAAPGAEARPGEELVEIRWAGTEEADELTESGIFEPVRQHIREAAGAG